MTKLVKRNIKLKDWMAESGVGYVFVGVDLWSIDTRVWEIMWKWEER